MKTKLLKNYLFNLVKNDILALDLESLSDSELDVKLNEIVIRIQNYENTL